MSRKGCFRQLFSVANAGSVVEIIKIWFKMKWRPIFEPASTCLKVINSAIRLWAKLLLHYFSNNFRCNLSTFITGCLAIMTIFHHVWISWQNLISQKNPKPLKLPIIWQYCKKDRKVSSLSKNYLHWEIFDVLQKSLRHLVAAVGYLKGYYGSNSASKNNRQFVSLTTMKTSNGKLF